MKKASQAGLRVRIRLYFGDPWGLDPERGPEVENCHFPVLPELDPHFFCGSASFFFSLDPLLLSAWVQNIVILINSKRSWIRIRIHIFENRWIRIRK